MIASELFDKRLLEKLSIRKVGYTDLSRPLSFDKYLQWVEKGDYIPLSYLADHRKELRSDLKNYYPEFKSALVFAFDYTRNKKTLEEIYHSDASNGLKISSYVFGFDGIDYHIELRDRMHKLLEQLKSKYSNLSASYTLDMHPVLERDLAHKTGLGWFGKNSMLINKEIGSFFMIGSLLLDQTFKIEPVNLEADHCGTCTACVDACPTDAIDVENRTIISNKCISTWTIEIFDDLKPIEGHLEKAQGEIFGCDICQDVCPWNIKELERTEGGLLRGEKNYLLKSFFLERPIEQIQQELEGMSNKAFVRKFKGTALERTGRKGLLKNIKLHNLN
jgi:epoxyqueuosine reductase